MCTAADCSWGSCKSAAGALPGNSGRTSVGRLGTAGTAGTGGPTVLGQAPKQEDKLKGSLSANYFSRLDLRLNLPIDVLIAK